MGNRSLLAMLGALTFTGICATSASAQMPGGAFERLAPGDQRIARSLFDAQRRDTAPGSRMSLDQIAARKNGEGWGVVFKDMKAQGLMTAKNLNQVVNRSPGRSHGAVIGGTTGVYRSHDEIVSSPAAGVRGHDDGK